MSDSDSDYVVEEFLKPSKISALPRNNEEGDILGNFDDEKLKITNYGSDNEPEENEDDDSVEIKHKEIKIKESSSEDSDDDNQEPENKHFKFNEDKKNKNELSDEQLKKLLTGTSKVNRFVLYVTNLARETTKERLHEAFSTIGAVKSIRIPKIRKSCFAFVEMMDILGLRCAFTLHNSMLDGRQIKVQISEGGKKKSANKKNIIKQKNRVLAEMRNESKSFLKSGKTFGYTKTAKNRARARAGEKHK